MINAGALTNSIPVGRLFIGVAMIPIASDSGILSRFLRLIEGGAGRQSTIPQGD